MQDWSIVSVGLSEPSVEQFGEKIWRGAKSFLRLDDCIHFSVVEFILV